MKRLIALFVISFLVITPNAQAVPKKITVNPLKLLTTIGSPTEVSGVVVSGKKLIVIGTQNSKAYVRALDSNGNELWKLQLDQSQASIASAAVVDGVGDIWIAGATPVAAVTPTGTTTASINPDNAIIPTSTFISDLKTLTIWKVSSVGTLLSTNSLPMSNSVLPTSITLDDSGLAIVGSIAGEKINAGFINFMNSSGLFSKTLQIGSASTTIESVTRNSDKTFTLVGSSAETIAGKKLAGLIDGIIIKVTKSLKITSVVRSSISKGKRIWNSTTSSLLLGGEVVVGKKSEVAVTKFSSRYVPTWTHRYPGTGPAFTSGSTQLLFLSNAAIPELVWNPKTPTALLITFNSKGVISAAENAPAGQRLLVGSLESKDLGPVVVTSSADIVSIFIRNTR
jgi:hypothetical protein